MVTDNQPTMFITNGEKKLFLINYASTQNLPISNRSVSEWVSEWVVFYLQYVRRCGVQWLLNSVVFLWIYTEEWRKPILPVSCQRKCFLLSIFMVSPWSVATRRPTHGQYRFQSISIWDSISIVYMFYFLSCYFFSQGFLGKSIHRH